MDDMTDETLDAIEPETPVESPDRTEAQQKVDDWLNDPAYQPKGDEPREDALDAPDKQEKGETE